MSALSARDVSVAFDGATVVKGVSLEVPQGSWVALIGPNGAGKSTFLRALAGLVDHTGTVVIDGMAAVKLSRRAIAQQVAFVPQRPRIPASMRVVDYVLLGRTPYVPYFAAETARDIDIAREVISTLELTHLAHRQLGTLSGGEAQRVVLARSLAQEAPILLLDEPTAALDVGHQQQVLELVDVLRSSHELTVISAMHDLTQASQFADVLVLLDRGRVVARGRAAEVLTEGAIREHFGASVRVLKDGDGSVLVIPTRSRGDETVDEVTPREGLNP